MLFKHLPLPDLIESWLHVQTPPMHKRTFLPKRRPTPQLVPITWQFATFDSSSSLRTPVKTLRRKLSGHLAGRKKETKFCESSQDEARSMSESARIAFAYRASQNFGRVVSDSDPRSSRGTHRAPGSDESQPNVEPAKTSDVQHKSSVLSDVLSRLSPVIIEKDDEEVLDQERCRLALRQHLSMCSNVVVESQWPDRTPHIVITPPPEQDVFEAPYIAQNNQIPFQHHLSLSVPPLSIQTCRMMTFEQWHAMFYQFPSFKRSVNQSTPANQLVFSRLKFTQWVKRTEEHRNCLFRRLLIPAVTRHLMKASAVTASILAPTFRARYDSPELLESLGNPFRWTDPAPAFLSLFRGHPVGVHHVPSPEPFSVPHILIEESFGNDQTIVDGNIAPIQNSADSKSLVVPASKNFSPSVDDLEIEEMSLDYDSSTCQSSPPKTPIEVGKVDYGFFSAWDIGAPLRDADLFPETQCHHPTTGTTHPYRDSKALFFIEEEDEDECI